MKSKDARGRYRDYAQRIVIKKVIDYLLKERKINPNVRAKLIIRIDQQATATDTNRKFVNDIKKELTVGMINLEYNIITRIVIITKRTITKIPIFSLLFFH